MPKTASQAVIFSIDFTGTHILLVVIIVIITPYFRCPSAMPAPSGKGAQDRKQGTELNRYKSDADRVLVSIMYTQYHRWPVGLQIPVHTWHDP
jgi:hypothetical protein